MNSRRSSQCSIAHPATPRLKLHIDRIGDFGFSDGLGDGQEIERGDGLGSLADELAEAFDESEEGDAANDISGDQYDARERYPSFQDAPKENNGIPVNRRSQYTRELSLSPPKQTMRSRHPHREDSVYDGSDYGDESDLEGVDGISPSLDARMAAVESLARRGTESNGSDGDNVVQRVADALKDLGSQAGVENGASRLITAHTALTSHLSAQTRTLLGLCHPLLSPMSSSPDERFIEEILPLLSELLLTLPTPARHTLSSMHSLHASTAELVSILTYLTDTLYMTRQTTSLASRRLRSAKETVDEMRKDAESRDEGNRWIANGKWETRLANRDCSKICDEVVGGFEEVCDGWRKRLVGGLGMEIPVA